MTNNWPRLDYLGWRETCSALHLYLQIAGKYRLAHSPWLNHSWNATFYVTPRGLASSPIPDGPGIEILFDLLTHEVVGTCGDGGRAAFALEPMTVAKFHSQFVALISELGGTPNFDGKPNEVPDPVPFREDDRDRPYDRDAVQRYHQALVAVDKVFNRFRTSFLGKSSPVHLFWGALDLAVTRFSGRRAPLHPGGIPALPDDVAQEAYDREVSSAGFWPGGGGIDYPAFYAYAYPAPNGYRRASVQPDSAFWHEQLSEFILPYDAVQTAQDGDAALMAFLRSTYEAAADLGNWDRDVLECAIGRPAAVRQPDAVSVQHRTPLPEEPVQREDGASKGRYHMLVDGSEAEMTYSRANKALLIIDHTEVPDALRGRRVGESMVRKAVDDARSEGFKIIPLCPFAKAQIDRNPELQDVLQRPS
ncbi:MAG: N-acetyltransferase [Paracoccus sp.]|nr:N-acetyltransferase [Croceicoccus sp.]MAN58031.1 N-acetyltransferase [Paracoccus sp. (in: a-proteobacteria)]|tara:strand:+ start:7313 stop:8569 length:1257 start_codon:yes stop_codon:yes gene_type:complete